MEEKKMLLQSQTMILLGIMAVLLAISLASIKTLNELRGEIHKAYQAKIEAYAENIWGELSKKLKKIELLSTHHLENDVVIDIQRELGALDYSIYNVDNSVRISEVCRALAHVLYLLRENNILMDTATTAKIEQVYSSAKKLQEMYETEKTSRNKLLYATEEDEGILRIYNNGMDAIKSISSID